MTRAAIIAFVVATLLMAAPAWAKDAGKVQTISALEAREMLAQDNKDTFLVDVRSRAEYTLLGHAPGAYNVPWRFLTDEFQVKGGPYRGGKARETGYQLSDQPNPDFVGVVQSLFKPDDQIIIISATGDQGAQAAGALAEAGFKQIHNIRHGFLGDPFLPKEEDKLAELYSPHYNLRGKVNGWVYWGLPVSHTVDPRMVYPPDLKRMQNQK